MLRTALRTKFGLGASALLVGFIFSACSPDQGQLGHLQITIRGTQDTSNIDLQLVAGIWTGTGDGTYDGTAPFLPVAVKLTNADGTQSYGASTQVSAAGLSVGQQCHGTSTFSIAAGQTTRGDIVLDCTSGQLGDVDLGLLTNISPATAAMTVVPGRIAEVGQTYKVRIVTTNPNGRVPGDLRVQSSLVCALGSSSVTTNATCSFTGPQSCGSFCPTCSSCDSYSCDQPTFAAAAGNEGACALGIGSTDVIGNTAQGSKTLFVVPVGQAATAVFNDPGDRCDGFTATNTPSGTTIAAGTIVSNGQPVAGAVVTVYDPAAVGTTNGFGQGTTDASGNFVITFNTVVGAIDLTHTFLNLKLGAVWSDASRFHTVERGNPARPPTP